MSRWPDDPTAYRPSSRWVGVVVVAVMLGIFALIGTWMWMSAHHSSLVTQLSGDWTGDGMTLSVSPETKTYQYSADDVQTRETGDLLVEGTIDGRSVSGRAPLPGFPPWGSSVNTSLLGREWTLKAEGTQRLVLADDSGQVIALRRSP